MANGKTVVIDADGIMGLQLRLSVMEKQMCDVNESFSELRDEMREDRKKFFDRFDLLAERLAKMEMDIALLSERQKQYSGQQVSVRDTLFSAGKWALALGAAAYAAVSALTNK